MPDDPTLQSPPHALLPQGHVPQPPAPPYAPAPAHEPQNAAEAGVVANPEVLAAQQPTPTAIPPAYPAQPPQPAPPVASPWARPGTTQPQISWDVSGYAPPPAVRLEPAAALAPHPGLYPLPPAAGQPVGAPVGGVAIANAPAAATNAVVADASASGGRRAKVQLRTSASILLFLVGLALGVVGLRLATPTHVGALDSFPTLDRSAIEPVPASAVAKELAQNDVHGLAQLLDSDTLTAIQTQLKPFVTFESVTFVGATSHDHDTIAGYVVRGRDPSGNLGLVGLVIRLRDGQVVAQ